MAPAILIPTATTTQRESYTSVVKGALTELLLPIHTQGPAPSSHRAYLSVASRADAFFSLTLPTPVPVPRIVFRRQRQAPRTQPAPAPSPTPTPTHTHAQRSALDPHAPPFYPTPAQGTTRPPTPFNPLAPVFTPRGPTPTPTPAPISSSTPTPTTVTATAARTCIIPATPWIYTSSYRLLRRSPDASESTASTRGRSPLSPAVAAASSSSSWLASPWSVSPWTVSPWTTPPSLGTPLVGYSLAGPAVTGSLLMALLRSGSEPLGEGQMGDYGPVGGPVRRERVGARGAERKGLVDFIKERTARRIERLWG